MRGAKQLALIALAATAIAPLWGCGSDRESDTVVNAGTVISDRAEYGRDANGLAYVGAATCIGCHEGFSWSSREVTDFLSGKHVIHSDHIAASSESECLGCHDPLGDGQGLEELIDAADVPSDAANGHVGLAAVTCENCHGAGEEHFGVGPIPVPSPDAAVCGSCHDALPESHLTYHPQADNIYTEYTASRHATARVRDGAVCSKCHTDEGGRLYKDVTTVAQLEAIVLPVEDGTSVQCRTCHNPHNAGGLLFETEYETCVTCHMSEKGDPATRDGMIYHEDRHMRVIADTHYDDPATTDEIEGYVVDADEVSGKSSCLVCHDVHAVEEIRADNETTTINDQWASSAHGGFLLEQKKAVMEYWADPAQDMDRTVTQTAAMIAASTTDAEAPGWVHYDWDKTEDTVPGDRTGRADCQRCHTATGLQNYLNATKLNNDDDLTNDVVYDPLDNDFSHLVDWSSTTGSGQNELLYCWGCHSDNSGGLRNPGPVTADYGTTYPDINGSNVCMACHTGRESGDTIAASTGDFSNLSFINSHYLAAGGTVFAATGYEYDVDGDSATDDYANVSYYAHDQIGMGTDADLADYEAANGTNGPCVGCHMTSDAGHLFLPVDVDDTTDKITAITSTICIECHDGSHGAAFVAEGGDATDVQAAADFLNTEEENFEAALDVLETALQAKGIFFAASYPYFFNDTDGSGTLDAVEIDRSNGFKNWGDATTGKPTMGAAFNFNLLAHDPGAWAHNRYYTKRLIFDSLEYLMDGAFDGEIVLAAGAAADYLDNDDATANIQRP